MLGLSNMNPNAISAYLKQVLKVSMVRTIGLLAGRGELPLKIITHCHHQGEPLFLIAFEGQTDPELVQIHSELQGNNQNHTWVPLGSVGKTLQYLKTNRVTHIVMAGGLHRPSWSELKLDWTGTRWLAKMGLKSFGDDGLLSSAIALLKAEGFGVLSAPDLLEGLLAPFGVMGHHHPNAADWKDIAYGKEIVKTLGNADIGQAVVIQQGLILSVEAIEGTEALLSRSALLRRDGPGGVLVKMAKPQQNRSVDLPTIGVDTIHQAQNAGLRGIAVEAGATQILNKDAVVQAADTAGLYLVGVLPE